MWYENENADLNRPSETDTTSSGVYIYVRRDFEQVEESDEMPAHWRWQEMKIPRDMWATCQSVTEQGEALDDVYTALTELAEMIAG